MKVYRRVLLLILSLAGLGIVWYCLFVYNEQRSIDRGVLVWEEKQERRECFGEGETVCEGFRQLYCL